MRKISAVLGALFFAVQIFLLAATLPAGAISADLAKKCREMAIKAHPPELAGSKPYAQAERDFFSDCVSKNGEMQDTSQPKAPPPPPPN